MLDMDMTSGQKAARTRAIKKAWAEYEEYTKASNDAYYAFAETLYPERNRVIDEAEAKRDQIIAEANAKCQEIYDEQMAKFNKAMESLETEITAKRHEAYAILKSKTEQYTKAGE